MELKEIEEQIRYCIDNGMASPVSDIIKNIQTYGTKQYNQALKDAAEKCNYPYKDEYGCGCNVPSIILSLKK